MERLEIRAPDGVNIPLTWFPADSARHALLLLPALGIRSQLYEPLAADLAQQGCSVCLLEQRGQGRSTLRPSYRVNISMSDYLDQDIPASLDWIQKRSGELPLLLGGHSLGGHLSTLYAGIEPLRIKGIVHIACSFPYFRDFPTIRSWQIRFLSLLVSMARIFPGYFPGAVIGFAGRESSTLMNEWRHWALSGNFDFDPSRPLAQGVKSYLGPVISIGLADDDFACEAGIKRALSLFNEHQVTRLELGHEQQGPYLGHFKWARQPDGVVNALIEWMNRELSAPDP